MLLNISYSLFWHTSAPDYELAPQRDPTSSAEAFLSPSKSKSPTKPTHGLKPQKSRAAFHSIVDQATDALDNALRDLRRGRPADPNEPPFTSSDLEILQHSIDCLENALADETWLALQGGRCGASLPFPVRGLPDGIESLTGIGLSVDGASYFLPTEVEEMRKMLPRGERADEVVLEATQSSKLNFVLSEVRNVFLFTLQCTS